MFVSRREINKPIISVTFFIQLKDSPNCEQNILQNITTERMTQCMYTLYYRVTLVVCDLVGLT